MDNKKLIKETPNLCIYPWIHLEANAMGRMRPCCLVNTPVGGLKDNMGKIYQLSDNNTTLEDAYTGQEMINLRKQFLNNERPDVCYKCWSNEDAGLRSLRQSQISEAQTGFFDIEKVDFSADPSFATNMQSVDLKLGTTCNLQCRICDASSSSKYYKETKTILTELEDTGFTIGKNGERSDREVNYYNLKEITKTRHWPTTNENFYDNLKIIFPNLKRMELYGGEPFLIKKHFNVLKYAIEKGYSKNIFIKYNTNGTQYPKELVEDIFPHFNRVFIAFSIDDVAERFEYQRYPAKWEQVKDNIQRFTELTNVNLGTEICVTINIFNILSLDELLGWVNTTNLDGIYFNILYDPQEWNIQSLPLEAKQYIVNKFRSINWPGVIKTGDMYKRIHSSHVHDINVGIQSILSFMEEKHITYNMETGVYGKAIKGDIQEVRNWRIQTFDKLRNENFVKTFPELAELIGYD